MKLTIKRQKPEYTQVADQDRAESTRRKITKPNLIYSTEIGLKPDQRKQKLRIIITLDPKGIPKHAKRQNIEKERENMKLTESN